MGERYNVAVHEAGHTVVARVVGLPSGMASILADDLFECEGHAVVGNADLAWHQWQLREKFRDYASAVRPRIIAAQAGHEAEVEILGTAIGNDDDDRQVVMACAEDLDVPVGHENAAIDRLRRF